MSADPSGLPEAAHAAAVSVNPASLDRLRGTVPGLRVVGEEIPVPLPVRYDPPEDCGLDRVLGAYGALRREPDAAGVLLLDVGTCITATVAVRDGGILGGAILPGVELMARSLADHTKQLPRVEPEAPAAALGRSTSESIRSGIHHAAVGAARELVRSLKAECETPLRVVAAGSGGGALAAHVPEVDAVHLFATLWGVYYAASCQ